MPLNQQWPERRFLPPGVVRSGAGGLIRLHLPAFEQYLHSCPHLREAWGRSYVILCGELGGNICARRKRGCLSSNESFGSDMGLLGPPVLMLVMTFHFE